MPVDAATFRAVLGQWPSGVTIVTTLVDGVRHGMTASSFSSVSLDPPLVSVCLSKTLYSHGLLEASGVFGINILAKDQAPLGKRFAGMTPEVDDRFFDLDVDTAETGSPLLADALGWLDCRIVETYPGGDHTIFVGEVLAGATPRVTAPLLFHSRAWGQFADLLPDQAHVVDDGVVDALRRSGASPGRVAEVVHALVGAGATVRAVDLTGHPPTDLELAALRSSRGAGATTGGETTALVASTSHVRTAAELGVAAVELVVEPGKDATDVAEPLATAHDLGLSVTVTVRDAFAADPLLALATVEAAARAGVDEVLLDDAAGHATPLSVRTFLQEAVTRTKPTPLALRPGDRTGLAQANALTAMKSGVRHLHGTLGGVDGVAALEDLLYLVATLEIDAPVDRSSVVQAARVLASVWSAPLPARTTTLDTASALVRTTSPVRTASADGTGGSA